VPCTWCTKSGAPKEAPRYPILGSRGQTAVRDMELDWHGVTVSAIYSHGIVVILLARTYKGSAVGFVLFLACTTEGRAGWAGRLVGRLKLFRFLACCQKRSAKPARLPKLGRRPILTSSNIDRDRKDDKEKIPPKGSRKTRKQKESLQYHLCHHDQALRGVS
jgi:hypothetical protein